MSVYANCPQCALDCLTAHNRLITDNCGHKKCRKCLINDEFSCYECIKNQQQNNNKELNKTILLTAQISNIENARSTKQKQQPKVEARKRALNSQLLAKATHIQRVPSKESEVGCKYLCTKCGKTFGSRSQKYYHISCGNESSKKYKCEHCQKYFSTRFHYNYHLESHAPQQYHCKHCNKVFQNRTVLARHEKRHQQQQQPTPPKKLSKANSIANLSFACNLCEKHYANKSRLKQHMQKHADKRHECPKCGKHFQRNSTLTLHLKRHNKSMETNLSCPDCFKQFSDYSGLLRHAKIHEAAIKFKCSLCDTICVRKDNMLRHMRNVHAAEYANKSVEIIMSSNANTSETETAEAGGKKPPSAETTLDMSAMLENAATATVAAQNTAAPTIEMPATAKLVQNSSVIKCIGNVEPVVVPPLCASVTDEEPEQTLSTLNNVIFCDLPTTATSAPQKARIKNNSYDPMEIYRKILIADDDDEDDEGSYMNNEPNAAGAYNEQEKVAAQHKYNEEQQQSRFPFNTTSNFSEMHWRKNFKYTYEYKDF